MAAHGIENIGNTPSLKKEKQHSIAAEKKPAKNFFF
jgi:hypothetical protein